MIYIALLTGLTFAYISGMHDGGTIIATTISSGLTAPEKARFIAGISNFAGAVILGTAVAFTISKSIVNSDTIISEGTTMCYIYVISSFCGCIFWDLLTWIIKLPSSSSHALIGSMVGAAVADFGFEDIFWKNIFFKVILAMLLSPVIGFIFGYMFLKIENAILKNADMKVAPFVRSLHKAGTVILAFSYGSNDSQKVMGLCALALAAKSNTVIQIPLWLVIMSSAALALGTVTGGKNMITTVGKNITKINIDNSFSSQLASISVVLFANITGLPISTTQVVTASVMGVGAEVTPRSVNWSVSKSILMAWLFTIPASMMCGFVFFKLLNLII